MIRKPNVVAVRRASDLANRPKRICAPPNTNGVLHKPVPVHRPVHVPDTVVSPAFIQKIVVHRGASLSVRVRRALVPTHFIAEVVFLGVRIIAGPPATEADELVRNGS